MLYARLLVWQVPLTCEVNTPNNEAVALTFSDVVETMQFKLVILKSSHR